MLEIFHYEFMQRAFVAGALIGLTAPLIGIFLVVRRYSLIADTLAHVSLLGIAIGLILNINPFVTAIIASVIASIVIEQLRSEKKLLTESVLSLFLSGALAMAVVLISITKGFNANLYNYLFGSISIVSANDIYIIIALASILIFAVLYFFKDLFLLSFDSELAIVNKVPVKFINLFLAILAALQVSISIRAVGVLLIGALMVIPVITSFQFGLGFKKTLILSIIFSEVSIFFGLYISYYFDLASGGTIVMLNLLFFVISLLFNKFKVRI